MTEKQKTFHYVINFVTGASVMLVLSMIVAFGPAQDWCGERARQAYCQHAFVCDDSLDHPMAKPRSTGQDWGLS
jgi:hypothetical protein